MTNLFGNTMTNHRKPLPNANVDYFDTREAVNALQADAYEKLPYTSRVLAEQLVRKAQHRRRQHRRRPIAPFQITRHFSTPIE